MNILKQIKALLIIRKAIKDTKEVLTMPPESTNTPAAPAKGSATMPTASKPWYTSLTIWANVAMTLFTSFTPELQAMVAAHPKAALVIAGITNLLLRLRTDSGVK